MIPQNNSASFIFDQNLEDRDTVRKNIFLDFLSPDNRIVYGTYRNLRRLDHIRSLSEALNIAVFLCGNYCFVPPSFVTQCSFVRAALHLKSAFLTERLILLPLRESSLEDFFDKKMAEYSSVRKEYSGLFAKRGKLFVQDYAKAIVRRKASVGLTISERWMEGPDQSNIWKPIVSIATVNDVEFLRKLPSLLKENGQSVTLSAMKNFFNHPLKVDDFLINQVLQHEYGKIYLDEYNAHIITNLPPKTTDFQLDLGDLSYDYNALKAALSPLGIWNIILKMSATSLTLLRDKYGYIEFIRCFEEVCHLYKRVDLIKRFYAKIAQDIKPIIKQTGSLDCLASLPSPLNLTDNELDELNGRLLESTRSPTLYSRQHLLSFNNCDPNRIFTMSNTLPLTQPAEVFFSYSHKDETLRDELATHLKLLERQSVITGWHDRRISAGSEWKGEIDNHLESASIILLLISADFLASDYCYDVEMTKAMARHHNGKARVIPIILRDCDWYDSPFGKLQALPKDAKPVTLWANRDAAFKDITFGIKQIVK